MTNQNSKFIISKQQVQHIAKLARLCLTGEEIKKYRKELSSILDYTAKLKEVRTTEIEPTSHPHLLENIFREDETKEERTERVNKLFEAAPEKKDGYVKVKAVL